MDIGVLAVLVVVAALIGAVLLLRRRPRGMSPEENERAVERQAYLTARVEDLRQVLARTDLSVEAKRAEAYAVLAQMESGNESGHLDAFIEDNRESVDAELGAAARPN